MCSRLAVNFGGQWSRLLGQLGDMFIVHRTLPPPQAPTHKGRVMCSSIVQWIVEETLFVSLVSHG